jgi:hypothetical protein
MTEPRRPPKDFATWCVVEPISHLCERYRKGAATVERWIETLPDDVRAARLENMLNLALKSGRGRPPKGFEFPPSGEDLQMARNISDANQRRADAAFEAHFVAIMHHYGNTAYPLPYRRAA